MSDAPLPIAGSDPKAFSIAKGMTLLNLYKVESDPLTGGMGRVFRVRHTGWNVDLALKQPKDELFQTEDQKDMFTRECEAWINLGLHPHIVSCYYVRDINDTPSIFSEWMDGGSLKDLIQSGALYEGDDQAALERILDISIQFARGLHYAHEGGLIHQDVKPDNLLLNKNGAAKVTDFGIAQARGILTVNSIAAEDETVACAGSGYTPAYCSMEQMNGEKLTRRTDVWSWAVSVLEMFTGERLWDNGVVAGLACDDYFQDARITVPEKVRNLLRRCFHKDEGKRPHDFAVIDTALTAIYQEEMNRAYHRIIPKAAADTADSLNNRALSFLDLGKYIESESCWEKVLALMPNHAEAIYNQSVYRWKNAKMDDMEVTHAITSGITENAGYYLAKIHLARGDGASAEKCLDSLKGEFDDVAVMKEQAKKLKGEKRIFYKEKFNGFVLVHPDGNRVLTGYHDDGLKLRDIDTGRLIRTFAVTDEPEVCFNRDGSQMLTGNWREHFITLWDVESGECIRTILKEARHLLDPVRPMRFSPDGNTAFGKITSFTDREKVLAVNLWDLSTGQCVQTFSEDMAADSFDYSPDGKLLHSVNTKTGDVYLWNTVDGKCIRIIKAGVITKDSFSSAVGFSLNGSRLFTNSEGNKITIWDVNSGRQICNFKNSEGIGCVRFSPDDHLVTAGKSITFWDTETGQSVRNFYGHSDTIRYVRFSNNGGLMLSGSHDKTAMLWDIPTGRCLHVLTGHRFSVDYVFLSPDGRMAVTESSRTAKLWDTAKGCCIRTYNGQFSRFRKEDCSVLIKLIDRNIEMWPVPHNNRAEMILSKINATEAVLTQQSQFDSREVEARDCLARKDITHALKALEELKKVPMFENSNTYYALKKEAARYCAASYVVGHRALHISHDTRNMDFSPDSNMIVTVDKDNKISVWDVSSGNLIRTLAESSASFECFSPDGHSHYAGSVYIWGTATGQRVKKIEIDDKIDNSHFFSIKSRVFSPNGDRVLICYTKVAKSGAITRTSEKSYLKLFDTETGKSIRSFDPLGKTDGKREPINLYHIIATDNGGYEVYPDTVKPNGHVFPPPLFTPDGQFVLVQNQTKEGKTLSFFTLLDIETGKSIRDFGLNSSYPKISCLSPNGKMVLACDLGYSIVLWDLSTGEFVRGLGHHIDVNSACFSPNGRMVLSGGRDKTIRLWDTEKGQCIYTIEGHIGEIHSVYFSPDGSKIAALYSGGISIYELDYDLSFPGWADWDDGARPYLENFLKLYPLYSDIDFQRLFTDLQNKGYGYLRPNGLKAKLKEMAGKDRV